LEGGQQEKRINCQTERKEHGEPSVSWKTIKKASQGEAPLSFPTHLHFHRKNSNCNCICSWESRTEKANLTSCFPAGHGQVSQEQNQDVAPSVGQNAETSIL